LTAILSNEKCQTELSEIVVQHMKIAIITRLFSGLARSMDNLEWKPYGVPAIYKLIEGLNGRRVTTDVYFLCKSEEESKNTKSIIKHKFIELPFVTFIVIPFYTLKVNSSKVKQIYNNSVQYSKLICRYLFCQSYDLFYLDRSNIVLASMLSFFGMKTVVRFLGIANFKYFTDRLRYRVISPLVYLGLKIPYSLVICTEDGSPSKKLFSECLNKKTPYSIILNGVDLNTAFEGELMSIRTKYSIKDHIPIILFVGRLTEDKGCLEFVDSLIKLKSYTYNYVAILICGDDDYSVLQNKINNNGLINNVIFEKHIEQKHIHSYFEQVDIYVSLNRMGNLSNTVLEAMTAGKCIIMLGKDEATHTDEVTEKLVPYDVVMRIDRNNIIDGLIERLIELIDNPKKITHYSEQMRAFANGFLWSWDERINCEIELLQKVARNESIEDRCLVRPKT